MLSEFFQGIAPNTSKNQTLQEQFLRFHLIPNTTVMLPLSQIKEVLTIPIGKIVPIPHMPSWVMGVFNWRGEILWMVDLGQLVGLTPWHEEKVSVSTYKAIVLNINSNNSNSNQNRNEMLGLIVNRVEDIEWCNPDEIQSPPSVTVTPELAPFLRGYLVKEQGEIMITLDGEAILAAMPKP